MCDLLNRAQRCLAATTPQSELQNQIAHQIALVSGNSHTARPFHDHGISALHAQASAWECDRIELDVHTFHARAGEAPLCVYINLDR